MSKVKIFNDDCFNILKTIENNSVDLILTDLPYGIMDKKENKYSWDVKLDTKLLFQEFSRVLRFRGRCLLFSVQPFTTELINSKLKVFNYNYTMYWYKKNFSNQLLVNKARASAIEEILLFTKDFDTENIHPLRDYAMQVYRYIGKSKSDIAKYISMGKIDHFFRFGSPQWSLCAEETYSLLVDIFNIDKMPNFKSYTKLKAIHRNFIKKHPAKYNIQLNKSNVFEYEREKERYHPCQKPVKLLEELINTYTNAGDTVLDVTMGSGSTGVAALNLGRNFIGIEKDRIFFEKAKERLAITHVCALCV